MAKYLFIFLSIILPFTAVAQLFDNWYFGAFAAIRFDSTGVVTLNNSAMTTLEGCATISNQHSDLLFYTDGSNIWNKNHQYMQNGSGLGGNYSSTQSALIVPWPLNTQKFIIFTASVQASVGGLKYSVVDMALGSGLGDVDSAHKNVQLVTPICEKLAAAQHSNDSDIWIVAKHFGTNAFYAYRITANGVVHTPVISNVGTATGVGLSGAAAIGYMRISEDGNRLACASWHQNVLEVFDFDRTTGVVSNAIAINYPFYHNGPYAIEFSFNGRFLYVAENEPHLYQFDLQASNIAASAVILDSVRDTTEFGALQRAPDGKIYIARGQMGYISVINNPDVLGAGCNYQPQAVFFPTGKFSTYGLPPKIEGYNPKNGFTFKSLCFGDSVFFYSQCLFYDSLFWDFGNPLAGASNFSSLQNPAHLYQNLGSFQVKLFVFYKGTIDTVIRTIDIVTHSFSLRKGGVVCDGDTVPIWVNAFSNCDSTIWYNGSKDSSVFVHQPGKYWAKQFLGGCVVSDTIEVDFIEYPEFTLRLDTAICSNHVLTLEVPQTNFDILWSTGETSRSIVVNKQGWYGVTLSNQQCSTFKRMYLDVYNCAPLLEMPNVFTPNNDGLNDIFKPSAFENVSHISISIYNRWGILVYQYTGDALQWDGFTNKGEKASEGVYFWSLEFRDLDNNAFERQGSVTLMGSAR